MNQINIAVTFIWIGFVLAISFMEAWLKFQAPDITIPLGLGIGKLVFSALNKVEWVCAIIIALTILKTKINNYQIIVFAIAILILIFQTAYALPVLDARANIYIAGGTPPPSNLHFIYIFVECIKVISLFAFGACQFNQFIKQYVNSTTK